MRYSIYNGTGYVAQNVHAGSIYSDNDIIECKIGLAACLKLDMLKQIDESESAMMYRDKECCNDGHRDNILDKYHTHVSIGIAYDDYYFAYVQNFENQYVNWTSPIAYDKSTTNVRMAGKFNDGGLEPYEIAISYDSLPTNQTYFENRDRTSYDDGEEIAYVLPSGFVLTNLSSITVIHSTQ